MSYYITDPVNQLVINTLEYKIDKMSGRDTTVLVPWTAIDTVGVTDDMYAFDVTIDANPTDNIQITIKVTDDENVEYYHKDSEVSVI